MLEIIENLMNKTKCAAFPYPFFFRRHVVSPMHQSVWIVYCASRCIVESPPSFSIWSEYCHNPIIMVWVRPSKQQHIVCVVPYLLFLVYTTSFLWILFSIIKNGLLLKRHNVLVRNALLHDEALKNVYKTLLNVVTWKL